MYHGSGVSLICNDVLCKWLQRWICYILLFCLCDCNVTYAFSALVIRGGGGVEEEIKGHEMRIQYMELHRNCEARIHNAT
jgi:hypothetical protein